MKYGRDRQDKVSWLDINPQCCYMVCASDHEATRMFEYIQSRISDVSVNRQDWFIASSFNDIYTAHKQ